MAESTYKFYCERAEAAASAAENATLENVRDRELRSEKTWRGLAERARASNIQREKAEREKAQQRLVEAEQMHSAWAIEGQPKLPG
ncbi:MAG: hypothetical protein IE933_02610 [Sphingomonadales bacterium]|nr:hypothetical protein [Sphingomonadales bacterium]MBD3775086.1 hypothetical protein [Paracoccaceae bacterium]